MKIEDVKKLSPQEILLYWISERESIRRKKELGLERPWTDDSILDTYRFCNVRRMDDKVSQWLLKNWYTPFRDHPNMLVAAALARHFNLPSCLEWLTNHVFRDGPPNWRKIKQEVRARKANGNTVFNGAYMVRGIGTSDKTEMVVDKVCQPLYEGLQEVDTNSMQKSVELLLPFWGFSSFMAGQVVSDLRWALTGRWKDRMTWAPIGPGSQRGMNSLLERPLSTKISQRQFETELSAMMNVCVNHLPTVITRRLEAMDYQNCLCEFDKYNRALSGEGRPKQLYRSVV